MTKTDLVNLVKRQVNVDLPNKPGTLNAMRKVFYTQITRSDQYRVLPLLNRHGIRYEPHIKDYYFIYLA